MPSAFDSALDRDFLSTRKQNSIAQRSGARKPLRDAAKTLQNTYG